MTNPLERITLTYGMAAAWVDAESYEDGSRWYWVGFLGDEHANGYRSTEFRDHRQCTEIINYERKIRGYGPLEKPVSDRGARLLVRAFNDVVRENESV